MRSRLVVAVAAKDLDHALICRMDLPTVAPEIGGELLGDGAGVFSRLRKKLRPKVVELGDHIPRIGGTAFAVEYYTRFQ